MQYSSVETAIIGIVVGVAVFLIGMKLMSEGLTKACGNSVRRLFRHSAKNRFVSLGIGTGATALIHSSAATSVMVIGFLAAGAMTVVQGLCVILGAYIGTTVTGIVAAFSSLPISKYLTLLAVVGVVLMFFKNERVKFIGLVLAGLGLLFFGLEALGAAFKQTDINKAMGDFCGSIENLSASPIIFLLIGALFTALVQSSSATSGIVIVMVGAGSIRFDSGIYLVLGATIGTVITTIIASIGGNANVKRTAIMCLVIRTFTALLGLAIIWPLARPIANFFYSSFGTPQIGLALFNVFYAIISVFLIIPFVNPIVSLFTKIIKDKDAEKKKSALQFIDDHLLGQPDVALMQVRREIKHMLQESYVNFKLGYEEIRDCHTNFSKDINEREDKIDYLNNAISEFLIKLSNNVSLKDEKMIGGFFHIINDIERIGDHASNFNEQAGIMLTNELAFSDAAKKEFSVMYEYIIEMFNLTINTFGHITGKELSELHFLEDKTDKLKHSLSQAHFERVTKEECTNEMSPYYATFLSELERIADHLVNVGYAFINPTGDEEVALAK